MSDGNYGKIINEHHLNRLSEYLNENHGGKVLIGGQIHKNTLCIMPTVI
jgi:acyl-CoA reductase-like NAD-dependent aldehyde dehydrogenase